jgi:chemosensory pili system protein ChpB (putative protein-glutamate methylesterase)
MPHAKPAANIGIIADNLLQQHLLKTALRHFCFKVILTTDPSKMNDNPDIKAEVDAWILDIVDEYDEHFWLDDLFDSDVPV